MPPNLHRRFPRSVLSQDVASAGNARIQGMTTDLHMGGDDYNVALFVFFIPVRCKPPRPSAEMACVRGTNLTHACVSIFSSRFPRTLFSSG